MKRCKTPNWRYLSNSKEGYDICSSAFQHFLVRGFRINWFMTQGQSIVQAWTQSPVETLRKGSLWGFIIGNLNIWSMYTGSNFNYFLDVKIDLKN